MRALVLKKYKRNKNSLVERQLPTEGDVLVKIGDVVKSFSKVAECLYSEKTQEMPFEGELLKKAGEKVFANELLWKSKKGILQAKEGKAPFSGIISSINEEEKTFIIKRQQRDYSLIAGAPGKIKNIIDKKAVLIEASVLEITGVAGKGEDVSGELVVLGTHKDPGNVEIDKNYAGKIIICGFLNSYLYSKAKFFGVLGFVCGGVDYSLYSSLSSNPSFIITTGFGQLLMDPMLFNYFKSVASRFIVLRPTLPQIIVPEEQDLKWASSIEGVYTDVKEGQIVQIFSQDHYGLVGTVLGFDKNKVKVEVWEEDKILKISPDNIGIIFQ